MDLTHYVETLNLLADESRLRLCALLRERELCVTDLVHVTGIAQSRVSTHLGRLREAGFVWDRRQGTQCFYGLAADTLPGTAKTVLDEASNSSDPTLLGDQKRLQELDAERRSGLPESVADELERYYSPGRTWQSLTVGIAALLKLGDVLDVDPSTYERPPENLDPAARELIRGIYKLQDRLLLVLDAERTVDLAVVRAA